MTGTEFTRDTNYIATRITRDGRDGYPVEPGRYRLIAARACPWANRAIIVRRLLGLEDVLSMGTVRPRPTTSGAGPSTSTPDGVDPVLGIDRLQEAYFARDPRLPAGHHRAGDRRRSPPASSSPTTTRRSPSTSRPSGPTITVRAPRTCTRRRCARRSTRSRELIFPDVNNGVYQAGFAGSQEAYERAYDRLFARLDWLTERLAGPALPGGRHASPRPTSGCSPRWPASTPSTTATSSATGAS